MTPGFPYSRSLALLPHRLHRQHPTERQHWETQASRTKAQVPQGQSWQTLCSAARKGAAYRPCSFERRVTHTICPSRPAANGGRSKGRGNAHALCFLVQIMETYVAVSSGQETRPPAAVHRSPLERSSYGRHLPSAGQTTGSQTMAAVSTCSWLSDRPSFVLGPSYVYCDSICHAWPTVCPSSSGLSLNLE